MLFDFYDRYEDVEAVGSAITRARWVSCCRWSCTARWCCCCCSPRAWRGCSRHRSSRRHRPSNRSRASEAPAVRRRRAAARRAGADAAAQGRGVGPRPSGGGARRSPSGRRTRCRSRAATPPSGSRPRPKSGPRAAVPNPEPSPPAAAARGPDGAARGARRAGGTAHRRGRAPAGRRARRSAARPAEVRPARVVQQPAGRRQRVRAGDPVRHQGRRVRAVDSPLRRPGQAQLVRAQRRLRDARPRDPPVQRPQGRLDHRREHRRGPRRSTRSTASAYNAIVASNPTAAAAAGVPGRQGVLHGDVLLQRVADARHCDPDPRPAARPARRRWRCWRCWSRGRWRADAAPPALVAILGPTATGKSAAAIAVARHFGGEIVACDSTAVYRGFDIGTDKVPPEAQQGIPHHLIDVAEPDRGLHGGALRARRRGGDPRHPRAAAGCRSSSAAPGSTSARLTRGLFPGPAADDGAARPARARRRRGAATARCTAGSAVSIRRRRRASSRAIASGWCARSRSICSPASR